MSKLALLASIIFYSLFVLSQNNTFNIVDIKRISKNKQTICSLTINSKDEIQYLHHQLNKNQFQFIELIPDQRVIEPGLDFLKQSCRILRTKNVKCDQFILSTHFGNHYWGKSGVRFNIKDLEELSCSNVCDNVLSHPKTKIAFACNMNAELEKTSRSPEQMRTDLIRDGLSSRDADLAVQSVNGVNAMSFKDRHSFIFHGGGPLIGFDRRSPSGPVMTNILKNFFNKGYVWSVDSPMDLMKLNTMTKNLGLTLNNTQSPLRQKMCAVINPDIHEDKKMMYYSSWLDDQDGYYLFSRFVDLITQKHFFQDLSAYQKQAFLKISQKINLKNKVLKDIQSIISPTVKHRWAFAAWKLGWMNDSEFVDVLSQSLVRFLRPPFPVDSSDRQDVIDEIGWMAERYKKSNHNSRLSMLRHISYAGLKKHLKNKSLSLFLEQDNEIMFEVFKRINPEDLELIKYLNKTFSGFKGGDW